MRRLAMALAAIVLPACGGVTSAAAPQDTVRVSFDDLVDGSATLPDNAGAIDLGEAAPPADLSFCEAFASMPARYVEGPMVATQLWVDSFVAARADAPSMAVDPIDRLVDFGEATLASNFGVADEPSTFDSSLAADARTIADVAVEACPDLPLVVGAPEESETPPGWLQKTPAELAESCENDAARVQEGIDWYHTEFGTLPAHQQQIKTSSLESWLRTAEEVGESQMVGLPYSTSDFYGVSPDGAPAAVAGGACDI